MKGNYNIKMNNLSFQITEMSTKLEHMSISKDKLKQEVLDKQIKIDEILDDLNTTKAALIEERKKTSLLNDKIQKDTENIISLNKENSKLAEEWKHEITSFTARIDQLKAQVDSLEKDKNTLTGKLNKSKLNVYLNMNSIGHKFIDFISEKPDAKIIKNLSLK